MTVPTVVVLVLLAAALGALLAWVMTRASYAARLATSATEGQLLRERIVDLEAALGEDRETAAQLAPLSATLQRVQEQVGVLERDRVQQFGSVASALARLEAGTSGVERATASLAGSLQSSSVRGRWGEVQLRRVLEVSGLLPRCDFDEQVSFAGEEGTLRPDVVVHLPGDRHIVVDAKAPMSAFLSAQSEDVTPAERATLLGEHAKALRSHVTGLDARGYGRRLRGSPDLVVCFVPSDAMLAGALHADPELHEWALGRGIALVGPSTLLALLRTVALAWQQESLTENAEELLELGQTLHRRLATLAEHAVKLGRSMHSGVQAYNGFVGALESRVLVTARRFEELGVRDGVLPEVPTVQDAPRPLAALELIEALGPDLSRPELLDPAAPAPTAGADAERSTG